MKYLLASLLCCFAFISDAQQIIWETTWGDTTVRNGWGIHLTKDSALVINATGETAPSSYLYPTYVLKYDLNGNPVWQTYGRITRGEQDLIELADSSFFFASSQVEASSTNLNETETFLQKLNKDGDTLWTVVYPSPQRWEIVSHLLLLDSGQVLMAGMRSVLPVVFDHQLYLRKVDSLGNEIWFREYGVNLNLHGSQMVKNSRGNLVLSGISDIPGSTLKLHPYLLEVSPQGNLIRERTIVVRDAQKDEIVSRAFNNILETKDGNYVVSGQYLDSAAYKMGFVVKLDTAFNIIWRYIYRPPGIYSSIGKIFEMPDSSFQMMTSDASPNEFAVLRLNKYGKFVGKRGFVSGICSNIFPFDWQVLNDTSYVMTGRCNNYGPAYIVKVEFPKILGDKEDIYTIEEPWLGQAYPNPAASLTKVPFTLPSNSTQAIISFYDVVKGRDVKSYRVPLSKEHSTLEVNLEEFANGMYAYSLVVDGNTIATKKLTVIR